MSAERRNTDAQAYACLLYTDVYKRQGNGRAHEERHCRQPRVSALCDCLLYTSRCV
ncbi:hypothetical protein [Burkholderia plantarii]|uniref:hypothetical protein n=1 Tax=Burkholderia plantarii TaxID=41899 RepID=UPI0014960DEB|nr:hypothetical protein [Burkholderia plantarii]